ncbi:hypothetical protein ACHAXM_007965 [Skeletonema potamos]|jgi:hypothetical protein
MIPLLVLQEGENSIARSAFRDAYDVHQAIHIRGYKPSNKVDNKAADFFHADDVQGLFDSLGEQDKKSWCIENQANHKPDNDDDCEHTDAFLRNNKKGRGYCSFLVQHSKEVLEDLLTNRLPMVHLPVKESDSSTAAATMKVDYGTALWLFFGKNYNSNETLQGRPEHTDSVTHDGTFHYQLSGTKIWRLRSTTELTQAMRNHRKQNQSSPSNKKRKVDEDACENEANYIEVECKEGDILLLNTRLWWHSTIIPSQDVPCISYARDIYFTQQKDESVHEQQPNRDSSMTNVDGTYAAADIEADTILFTERNMPDIELPRCKSDPNCQVVELEDEEGDSFMAVVTLRAIKSGEFFTLLESDDEEDESGDEVYCEEAWEEEE